MNTRDYIKDAQVINLEKVPCSTFYWKKLTDYCTQLFCHVDFPFKFFDKMQKAFWSVSIGVFLACGTFKRFVNLQYNTLVCWVDGTINSSTKHLMFKVVFFFIKSLQKPFQFISFTKMEIKSFECPIRNYEKKNTWNIRHLFDESFVSWRTTAYYIIDCRIYHLLSASLVQTVQTVL